MFQPEKDRKIPQWRLNLHGHGVKAWSVSALRDYSSSEERVSFLIPSWSVRQRWWGSEAERLDVSERGVGVKVGHIGAAHQRPEWSRAALLLMSPWNHSRTPAVYFPQTQPSQSPLHRARVCNGDSPENRTCLRADPVEQNMQKMMLIRSFFASLVLCDVRTGSTCRHHVQSKA